MKSFVSTLIHIFVCVFVSKVVSEQLQSVIFGVWPLISPTVLGGITAAGVDAASIQSVVHTF